MQPTAELRSGDDPHGQEDQTQGRRGAQVVHHPDNRDAEAHENARVGQTRWRRHQLAGQLLLPEEELTKLVLIKPGEVFSREKMTDTTKAISERLGNEGYAFANVNAIPELDKVKREVSFTFFVDPGRRVYVRSGRERLRVREHPHPQQVRRERLRPGVDAGEFCPILDDPAVG